MENDNYVLELINLIEEEQVIRRAIDTYNIDRDQRNCLFQQLKIINGKKETIQFKIKLNEKLKVDEKSR